MKLSKKAVYALEAIVDLALHLNQSHVNLTNISKRLDISNNYLRQIFIVLKKNNIVTSFRGPQGGYILCRNPEEITVGEIIRALEGDMEPVDCFKNNLCFMYDICITRVIWSKIQKTINNTTDSITVKDLINSYNLSEEV